MTSGLLTKRAKLKLNLKLSCYIHVAIRGVIKGITLCERDC